MYNKKESGECAAFDLLALPSNGTHCWLVYCQAQKALLWGAVEIRWRSRDSVHGRFEACWDPKI